MSGLKIIGDGEVVIAPSARISPSAQAVFQKPGRITIGDYCTIGPDVKFVCDGESARIGDWSTIHDRSLLLVGRGISIGEHCWFGQNTVLDGTGGLQIGRGVRVGMYSQIWSHAAAGEQIEGCTLFVERPVEIADEVWLVGSCIVGSGVTLGSRIVALIGSNITKSFPPNAVLAGSPAKRRDDLSFYRPIDLDEKWALIDRWIREFEGERVELIVDSQSPAISLRAKESLEGQRVIFVRDLATAREIRESSPEATVCCIEDKSYTKRLTQLEQLVLRSLASNRARFYAVG